jgi:hypothetical protein
MYNSFVRPLLEYADVVWDNLTDEQNKEIESVQNEAARIVAGATKLCNINKLISELGWESLENRRNKHKLILLYKMKNHISPSYLSNLLTPTQQSAYNLRHIDDLTPGSTRTHLCSKSFLPPTIRTWNSLPETLRSSPILNSFKSKITPNIKRPPSYYNTGTRKDQILLTIIRLGSLNEDLFRKSIVESPTCTCGMRETVSHFLLQCTKYRNIRERFLTNLNCPATVNNLLYGNEHHSSDENKTLFQNVQKFITQSKLFL